MMTESKSLKIVDEYDAVSAVCKHVKRKDSLSSTRQKLGDEIEKEYNFLVYDVPLKRKQESKTFVEDCIEERGGEWVMKIKEIQPEFPTSDKVITKSKKDERMMIDVEDDDNASWLDGKETKLANSTAQDLIKLYSEDDIEKAVGIFAKEKMRHHNSMVEKIKKDSSLNDWGVQALMGVIESAWVMKKPDLLKLKVKEICLNEEFKKASEKERVLMGCLEVLELEYFTVKNNYKALCIQVQEDEAKRPKLEKEFDQCFSSLKKAQANLQKSIEVSLQSLNQNDRHTTASGVADQYADDNNIFTEEEMSTLVDDIKKGYESIN